MVKYVISRMRTSWCDLWHPHEVSSDPQKITILREMALFTNFWNIGVRGQCAMSHLNYTVMLLPLPQSQSCWYNVLVILSPCWQNDWISWIFFLHKARKSKMFGLTSDKYYWKLSLLGEVPLGQSANDGILLTQQVQLYLITVISIS